MSYYPTNFYGNYPYNQYQSFPSIPQQQQPSFLQGKIVDSIDVVKATDVPVGGYSIFPKADFSEMYIKSWNNNRSMLFHMFLNTLQSFEKFHMTQLIDLVMTNCLYSGMTKCFFYIIN